jgi:hypothetical protein
MMVVDKKGKVRIKAEKVLEAFNSESSAKVPTATKITQRFQYLQKKLRNKSLLALIDKRVADDKEARERNAKKQVVDDKEARNSKNGDGGASDDGRHDDADDTSSSSSSDESASEEEQQKKPVKSARAAEDPDAAQTVAKKLRSEPSNDKKKKVNEAVAKTRKKSKKIGLKRK